MALGVILFLKLMCFYLNNITARQLQVLGPYRGKKCVSLIQRSSIYGHKILIHLENPLAHTLDDLAWSDYKK